MNKTNQTVDNLGVVDTHVHTWNLETASYKWLEAAPSLLNRNYHLEELQPSLQSAGISAIVLVQSANNLEDTYWMFEVAQRYNQVVAVVGWLPLQEPGKVYQLLQESFLANPYFKGVRHLIHNEPDPRWLLQQPVLESLSLLSSYNIPFDVVGINNDHLETVIRVSEKLPPLRMVLDHLNQPPIASGSRFGKWGALIRELSATPNVYAKISGLGTAAQKSDQWSADDIEPYIEFCLTHFSTNRCFCGGDWPVSLLAGSYERHWNMYRTVLARLLEGETLKNVSSKNALNFYGCQTD